MTAVAQIKMPQSTPPVAERTWRLRDLRLLALKEGERIESGQQALIKAGMREYADLVATERAEGLYALARVVNLLVSDPVLNAQFRAAVKRMLPTRPLEDPAEAEVSSEVEGASEADQNDGGEE